MSPHLKIPSHEAAVVECLKHGKLNGGFRYNGHVWIKYGMAVPLFLAEAEMQQYVRKHADHSIVYIPKVLDVFKAHNPDRGGEMAVIVMEFIEGEDCTSLFKDHTAPTKEEEKILKAIVNALHHIWEIPLPENAKIGPFGDSQPIGGFFGSCFCEETFKNLHELESWINKMLKEVRSKKQVSLAGEPLCICHCDPHASNIILGETITFIDWGFSGIYPRCIDEWAIFNVGNVLDIAFGEALYQQIFRHETPEHKERIRTLARAQQYIHLGV